MKKHLFVLISLSFLLLAGCDKKSTEMDAGYNGTFDITYTVGKLIEYDPANINGIDVAPYFDFFPTLRFTLHAVEGKFVTVTFDNAEVPFSPFSYQFPSGSVECEFVETVLPHELRIRGTDEVIAYFRNGEFYIPFRLDCQDISYEYRFKEVAQ